MSGETAKGTESRSELETVVYAVLLEILQEE